MTLSAPPDPGESSGTGPPLQVIQTEDIEIFSDINWIQPGRFSDILYGYCHSLAETVALKRLRVPDDGECSARDLRLFNEEATIWHTLDHPHVLPLRGIYVCPAGFTYLVSPYMNNGDLMSYLKHNPLVDRRGLLCDIASAIAYLHSLEIVHGDIKARNILVSQDGDVRLCDFGLSKYSSWTTSEGRKGAGTIRWQSPELLFDQSKSFKSDVYAFGITIYEVLSGNIPFGASSDGAIVYNVVLRNTRPPTLPKFSPTGQSYATTWALARECWHRVPDSRPEMVQVWKRLEMEVFPEATLRVLVAEKERVTARSARVFKGGTSSATGGVGPPSRTTRRGRGFTVDADGDDEEDDDAEESDNELGLRRHTINVDAISHSHLAEPAADDDMCTCDEPATTDGYFMQDAVDEEEEEEEEFLITPYDSPLLGATEGPVCRTGRGGLLPTGGGELEAIEEDFTLDGDDDDDNGNLTNDDFEQVEAQSVPTRILPGVPAKDSKSLKKGGALGGNRNPVGRSIPWGSTKSTGGGEPTKSGQRRRRRNEQDSTDGEDDDDTTGIGRSRPGQMADAVDSSSGYYGYFISTITSAYECTKSMIMSGGNDRSSSSSNPTKGKGKPHDQTKSITSGGAEQKRLQPSSVDWAHWDGTSVSSLEGA
ncbi:hypothetical protein FRC04_006041 [Tulasnella sp. 424]|nr:hypothetical protein FRC04_006041 [Tulasnella sp. 424]KAG8975634.1 hypothetical protein FRC05_005427 [Tulasnella sp. 425]